MSPARLTMLGLGTLFVGILLFTTLHSTSTPLDLSPRDRATAHNACQSSVQARIPGARFPMDPKIESREADALFLSGSVDSGSADQAIRRNYSCLLRRVRFGSYEVDSVTVWQSH